MSEEITIYLPRVCATEEERTPRHGTEKPNEVCKVYQFNLNPNYRLSWSEFAGFKAIFDGWSEL